MRPSASSPGSLGFWVSWSGGLELVTLLGGSDRSVGEPPAVVRKGLSVGPEALGEGRLGPCIAGWLWSSPLTVGSLTYGL